MRELLRIVEEKRSEIFKLRFPVPRRYEESLEAVQRRGLALQPNDIWRAPLRGGDHDNFIYHASMQRDGAEGLVAQHMMQPEEKCFDESFIVLSPEILGIEPSEDVGALYARSKELGLQKCPFSLIAAACIAGFAVEQPGVLTFVTDPIRKGGRERLYSLSRYAGQANPQGFGFVYSGPSIRISEMDADSRISCSPYVKEYDQGTLEFTGLRKPVRDDHSEQQAKTLHRRFIFKLPKEALIESPERSLIAAL